MENSNECITAQGGDFSNLKFIAELPYYELIKDQNGELYAELPESSTKRMLLPIRGGGFTNYIRFMFFAMKDQHIGRHKVEKIQDQFEAQCQYSGRSRELFNRVGEFEGCFFVDGKEETYKISPGKWEVDPSPPTIFKHFQGMNSLPRPVPGGDIRKILNFANIPGRSDQLLLMTFLAGCFLPKIQHPILVLWGSQGAAKSSLLRRLLSIADPRSSDETPHYDEKEFLTAINARWATGLDNVSYISPQFSDLLCRLVTGAAFTKRRLFTDEDLIVRRLLRIIIMNGINLPVEKPDLMDRCVLLQMDRISNENRKEEAVLDQEFSAVSGEILGGCFDAVSRAMEIYPTLEITSPFRLKDYARWGTAISMALGYQADEFLLALKENVERQHEHSLDASPVASLISHYFVANPRQAKLQGTPSEIFRELDSIAGKAGISERQMPRSPRDFGRKLEECRHNLESQGYEISRSRGKERKLIIARPGGSQTPSLTTMPTLFSRLQPQQPT